MSEISLHCISTEINQCDNLRTDCERLRKLKLEREKRLGNTEYRKVTQKKTKTSLTDPMSAIESYC